MAEKRMFSMSVIDSDLFLDMSPTAQLLYFHLSMRADDEGFVNSPKKIQKMIGASEDDIRALVARQFIIPFESGIIVIRHWKIHNYIRKDRLKDTIYQEEREMVLVGNDGSYQVNPDVCYIDCNDVTDICQPSGSQMSVTCQSSGSIDKIRLDQNRLEQNSVIDSTEKPPKKKAVKRFVPPTVEEVHAYIMEKGYFIDPEVFVDFYQSKGWMVGKDKMKDWKAAVRNWARREKEKYGTGKASKPPERSEFEEYYI